LRGALQMERPVVFGAHCPSPLSGGPPCPFQIA
jgi:hypothetical protein